MMGIYAYFDKKDNSVVYIGKDSYIDRSKRRICHRSPSHHNSQTFNKILQNNPNRYIYQVLVWDVKDQDTLNALEIQYIRQLKPKFNFTDGGDGCTGYKHSKELKQRFSRLQKGKNNSFYGKNHSKETKREIGKAISKYSLWDVARCYYDKSKMHKPFRELNPCKCFYLKYNGYVIPCGLFIDFISVEIISNMIEQEYGE